MIHRFDKTCECNEIADYVDRKKAKWNNTDYGQTYFIIDED